MTAGNDASRGRGDAATGGGGRHDVRSVELNDQLAEITRRIGSIGNHVNDTDGQRSGVRVAVRIDTDLGVTGNS